MAGTPNPAEPASGRAPRPTAAPPILVVEDDTALARLMEALLTSAGHTVRTVADGESAVTAVRDARPALVLLDLTIPKLDGWQVLERLRAGGDAPPVVLFTGDHSASRRAHQAGVAAAILKPFDVDELLATVERLLATPADGDEEATRS
ncbi:MAG: response regulator transcription factor [Dehalococcoidia bacterium]